MAFDNMFTVDKNTTDLFPLVRDELSDIPPKLIRFISEHGGKVYLSRPFNPLFWKRNCLKPPHSFSYGGKILESSYCSDIYKSIILSSQPDEFIQNGNPHSPILHEFFHLIDFVLGDWDNGSLLNERLPKGTPLDWYAATNDLEKFAVAGEAFCHAELFTSKDYRTHNKLELFRRAPEHFAWFEQLFKDWS